MRIGITGGTGSVDDIVQQAVDAEHDGFASIWYTNPVNRDPLVAIAIAGRATSRIELGTSVLETYPAHPLLTANRAASVVNAMGRPGFALGIGPSHQVAIERVFGMSFARPGQHTEEYTRIVAAALRGEEIDFEGELLSAHPFGAPTLPAHPVPLLLGALAPRMLRIAGELADGTVTWLATARAIGEHVAPRIGAAAAGRPSPRIVAGLPVAVHDDIDEACSALEKSLRMYAPMPIYQRILEIGGARNPVDAAIVGDEAAVTAQLQALIDAGASDIWARPLPVGDREKSLGRTVDLLSSLASPNSAG